MIPHAVQFEESFYDFLVRLCNRNGEFLYCENNQLHLGAALSQSFEITESEGSIDIEYNDCDTSGNPEFNEIIYPDAYFEGITKPGKAVLDDENTYARWDDYLPPAPTAISYAKSIIEADSVWTGCMATALKAAIQSSMSGKFRHETNQKYLNTYFKKDDDSYLDEVYQFCDKDSPLKGDFYKNKFLKEEEVKSKQVLVTCTTCLEPKLGDKVVIGGTQYVVYQVTGGVKEKKENPTVYEEYYELLLLPLIDGKPYPLPMAEKWIRRASTQRAVVVNNFDPKKLGRVQVKYNDWVGNNDATPWVNVSYPKASDGQGFMFMPDIEDVVLIDYEDGNVERPYMVGSFYDDNREPSAPASMYQVGVTKSITSANGHHISFMDPPGGSAKFLAELIPIWSIVSKYGEWTKWGDKEKLERSKYFSGGFEIGDHMGIYSITGSTHEREITINSPLGEVSINAFTGITINAPLGDVKIVGKNVEIEAKNNLTLTSGTRIPKDYYSFRGKNTGYRMLGTFGGGALGILGFDLSFYRTWFEAFFKPIGGTMLIKSCRYMQLEAGEGETNIVRTRKHFKEQHNRITKVWGRSAFDDASDLGTYKSKIDGAVTEIVNAVKSRNEFREVYNELIKSVDKFKAAASNLQDETFKKVSGCLVVQNNQQNNIKEVLYVEGYKNALQGQQQGQQQQGQQQASPTPPSATIPDDLKSAVEELKVGLEKLLSKEKALNDAKNLINENSWTTLFDVGTLVNNIKDADTNSTLRQDNKVEEGALKEFVVEKLKNLVLNTASGLMLNSKIKFEEGKVNDPNLFEFKKTFEPLSNDELENPVQPGMGGVGMGIWNALKNATIETLGSGGLYDDCAWGKNEKGGIYMSAHRGKSYYMHEDGTLKLGNKFNIDNVLLAEYLRDKVWNLKLD